MASGDDQIKRLLEYRASYRRESRFAMSGCRSLMRTAELSFNGIAYIVGPFASHARLSENNWRGGVLKLRRGMPSIALTPSGGSRQSSCRMAHE